MKKVSKKIIMLSLTVVLVCSVNVMPFASAATITLTPYTGQTATGNYSISTAAQLAKLASMVNASTSNSYSGSTFTLTADINLANSDTYTVDDNTTLSWTGGTTWTPIGGGWSTNTGTPSGKYFAGVFNGYDETTNTQHTITGMTVNSGNSGIGLFGYVNGGILGNVNVTGTVTCSAARAAIGGVVGYTNGSLINCTSNVNVTATNGKPGNIGGLAGIVENTVSSPVAASTVTVRGCKSTGNVSTSGTRVGGMIGSVYCTANGGVVVDSCSVTDKDNSTTDHDIQSSNSAYKTFIGGLIGYCEGYVSNCLVGEKVNVYASSGSDGHRMGGMIGILSSYGADAKMAECVVLGSVTNYNSNTLYDAAICVPESNTTMVNCFYIDSVGPGQYTGYSATNVMGLTEDQLKSNDPVSGTTYISDYLNVAPSWEAEYHDEWTCTAGSFPVLVAHPVTTNAALNGYGRGTSYTGNNTAYTNATTPVYYDATASTNGSGTAASPFNVLSDAVNALSSTRTVLCVNSAISVSDYNAVVADSTLAAKLSGKTIGRNYTYTGSIFTVSSGSLSLSNITIDGNASTRGNEPLISVEGGSVTLGTNATLTNNKTVKRGSAVWIGSGSFTMNAGSITDNTSARGGIIYVANGATFTLGSSNGIDSDQAVYLNNTTYNDCHIVLTSSLSSNLTVICSNPVAGNSGTGTIVAEGVDDT